MLVSSMRNNNLKSWNVLLISDQEYNKKVDPMRFEIVAEKSIDVLGDSKIKRKNKIDQIRTLKYSILIE